MKHSFADYMINVFIVMVTVFLLVVAVCGAAVIIDRTIKSINETTSLVEKP